MATEQQEATSRFVLEVADLSLYDNETISAKLFVLLGKYRKLEVAELIHVLGAIKQFRPDLFPDLINQTRALNSAALHFLPAGR